MSDKDGEKEEPEDIKVILIGDSGVGKTNLINTCVGLEFQDGRSPTISGSFLEKILEINGEKYSVNLWDTAGQEVYRGVTKLFFKGSQIVILVYDITNHESFKSLEEWIKITKEIIDNKFIYGIVGNKNDLYLNSQVKEEEARNLAETIHSQLQLVSAKTDPQSFIDYLTNLVIRYKNKNLDQRKNNANNIKLKEIKINDNEKRNCFGCIKGNNRSKA